jgi:ATP-dependent Clp protease, protease subunit
VEDFDMGRHNLDHVTYFHTYGLHIPTRTIYLDTSTDSEGDADGVNYVMSTRFIKNFHILSNMGKDNITVILNTCGGSIFEGMAIYDTIRSSDKIHVTIKVLCQASSMGSIILQAGDEIVLAPHSTVFFHLGTPDATGNNIYEVMNSAKHELEFGSKIDNILYERIKEKHDKDNKAFTKAKFNDINFKGKFMGAEEAVEMGLADRIE